jgi:hypothetical protein
MIKQMGSFKMINKTQAKKLYQLTQVWMVGSNVNSYHFLDGWGLAYGIDKTTDFDEQLNSFLFYLEPELGRYARFFIK